MDKQHAGAWFVDPERQSAKERQLAQWFLALGEVFAWHLGVVVDGVSFKRKDDIWRMTVQGRRVLGGSKRRNVVTWFYGADAFDCLWAAAQDVRHNQVTWHDDRYPVHRVT